MIIKQGGIETLSTLTVFEVRGGKREYKAVRTEYKLLREKYALLKSRFSPLVINSSLYLQDEEGFRTRRAKYQSLEGRLSQKGNMVHHHNNLSSQFGSTGGNTNSMSRSSQVAGKITKHCLKRNL